MLVLGLFLVARQVCRADSEASSSASAGSGSASADGSSATSSVFASDERENSETAATTQNEVKVAAEAPVNFENINQPSLENSEEKVESANIDISKIESQQKEILDQIAKVDERSIKLLNLYLAGLGGIIFILALSIINLIRR